MPFVEGKKVSIRAMANMSIECPRCPRPTGFYSMQVVNRQWNKKEFEFEAECPDCKTPLGKFKVKLEKISD